MARDKKEADNTHGAKLGFEQTLWAAADQLRGHMDAAEYKHVVLGLIYLKYISDAFEEYHQCLLEKTADPESDYYVSDIDFLVDTESGRSLLDLGGLLMDLRELLGRDVDMVSESRERWLALAMPWSRLCYASRASTP